MSPTVRPPAAGPARVGAAPCLAVLAGLLLAGTAQAKQPADVAGPWTLSFDKTGANCRVLLQSTRTDRGDYFLTMPTACRHAMPGIAAVGRWSMPDDRHVALGDPGGTTLLTLAASGDGFALAGPIGTYGLQPAGSGLNAAAPAMPDAPAGSPPAAAPVIVRVAARPAESEGELAGRYAVMRDKRDTGCMITLDKARAKGGDRAQLAPGCRDQGIVVFDPAAWQVVHGDIVLTARAGHKTKLERQGDGGWAKDPKEGGKPLGLKKL